MSIRWEFERDTRFNVPVKVEITDSQFDGAKTVLDFIGNKPLIIESGIPNDSLFKNIFGSFVELKLRGSTGDFEDLFDRNNTRFRIKVYIDGSFDSEYIPITDAFSEPVTSGNYEVTLRGAGVAALKQVNIFDIINSSTYITKLDAIYDIVNHYYNYDVVDATIEYPTDTYSNRSALSQIYINPARWDEDTTAYDALDSLITEPHQIRLTQGKAFIFPVGEPSFVGYTYDGSIIGNAVDYETDTSSTSIGGRLAKVRRRREVYDGVERTYSPGDTPILIKNGSFDSLENFNYGTSGSLFAGRPKLWNRIEGDNDPQIIEQDSSVNPISWRFRYANESFIEDGSLIYATSGKWEYESVFVNEGQRISLSGVASNSNIELTFVLMQQVQIGDYYLTLNELSGNPADWTEYKWVKNPTFQETFIPVAVNGRTSFKIDAPPVPEGGIMSYRVTDPSIALQFSPLISSPVTTTDIGNAGIEDADYIDLQRIAVEPVNADGETITSSKNLTGTRGNVFKYKEIFGDGFTSDNAGAIKYKAILSEGDLTPSNEWNIKGLRTRDTLADVQGEYLLTELSEDRDLIRGTVNAYDLISLIDTKRVSYCRTDFRYGRSEIELMELKTDALDGSPVIVSLTATAQDEGVKLCYEVDDFLPMLEVKVNGASVSFGSVQYLVESAPGEFSRNALGSCISSGTVTTSVDSPNEISVTGSLVASGTVTTSAESSITFGAEPTVCKTSTGLRVEWTAEAEADSYNLQRSEDSGAWTTISTGFIGTTYNDSYPSTVPDTTIQYRVSACNEFGCGAYSDPSIATTYNSALSC